MEYMLVPLRRYADFSGRSRRMEYWMWKLFLFLVGIAFWVVMMVVGGAALAAGDPQAMVAAGGGVMIVMLIYLLFGLAVIIPDLAVTVRRLHDTNRTGWWILAPLVPYLVATVAMIGSGSTGEQGGIAAGGVFALVAMLVAFVLCIMLLVFMFLDGTLGPNRFGPDPKGASEADHRQTFA